MIVDNLAPGTRDQGKVADPYLAAFLRASHEGSSVLGSGQDPFNTTSVISFTLVDGETLGSHHEITRDTRILVGIRNASTSVTHPSVVSTPTQRLPRAVLHDMIRNSEIHELSQETGLWFPEQLLWVGRLESGMQRSVDTKAHNATIYAVEALLSRKLGVADNLERGELTFAASPVGLLIGSVLSGATVNGAPASDVHHAAQLRQHTVAVEIDGEQYRKEYHAMCSMRVIINSSAVFPSCTATYSSLKWISVAQFIQMAQQRDVKLAFDVGFESEYCVHGLCLTSAYVYLSALGLVSGGAE